MPGRGEWTLVGRDVELKTIEDVVAARVPGLVLVGDAGVGKTRLLREALAHAGDNGVECHWVSATGAARSIPFGAVSHLIPAPSRPHADPMGLVVTVERDFARRSAGRTVMIGIDDAHLLDEPSAGLLHQLAVHGLAVAVATVRAGEPLSDALTSLWTGSGRRLEVRPLPATAVDHLLDEAAPGPLDALSRRRLRQLADGNPLLLRELLADAMETGGLHEVRGVWRWRGTASGSPRLAELVSARLRALEPAARQVLEVVACGEPLSLTLLERFVDPAAIEAAERSGMVVAERSGARTALRMAHPLYGEALRASMPASRSRTVFGQLADVLASMPLRRRDDALVAGVWQLRSGSVRHPAIALAAARQAIDRFDIDLAERLARTAYDAGQGWEAQWLLARVLQYQARSQEAFDMLPPAPPAGSKRLAIWAITRAGLLYWGLDRIDEAHETLRMVPEGSPGHDLAEATRSWVLFYDGRCEAALEVGRAVLARPDTGVRAASWATMGAASAAGMLGRLGLAAELARRGRAVLAAAPEHLPWNEAQVGLGLCYARYAAGELAEAVELADEGYRAAVASDARGMVAVWAGFRGIIGKAQGQLDAAEADLREAIALVEENDQYHLVRTYWAELAGVRALAGDLPGARRWLAAADARERTANRIFHAWVELNRAWVQVAEGDLTAAIRTARHAADLARGSEQPTIEAVALYECARLGAPEPVRDRLNVLADQLGGLAATLAGAADGLLRDDGPALEAAADDLVARGHTLLAAEAVGVAARAYARRGRPRLAVAQRAATLAEACRGVRTPLLAATAVGVEQATLTRRERDVALLAVALSSRSIADRLGLSVNTVNNNLARVFTKLGVRNRRELAVVLGHQASGGTETGHRERSPLDSR
ncbi:AAA family ATPase [Micromonospora sp. RB23]